jgi:hypothetical protein
MAVAATVLSILVAGVGCGEGGSDSSSDSASTGGGASAKASAGTTAGGNKSSGGASGTTTLAGLDYCRVLSAESLSPLGYQPGDGTPDAKGHDGGCTYDGKKNNRVVLLADVDTIKIDTSQGRTFDVSGFQSVASQDSDDACQLDVEVDEDGLTVIVENAYGDEPALHGKACEVAVGLAKQVVAAAAKA